MYKCTPNSYKILLIFLLFPIHVFMYTCSITSLCINTIMGDQKLGSGLLSTSPAIIFKVCHKKESLRPCKNMASKVVDKELVLSHNSRHSKSKTNENICINFYFSLVKVLISSHPHLFYFHAHHIQFP